MCVGLIYLCDSSGYVLCVMKKRCSVSASADNKLCVCLCVFKRAGIWLYMIFHTGQVRFLMTAVECKHIEAEKVHTHTHLKLGWGFYLQLPLYLYVNRTVTEGGFLHCIFFHCH